MTQEFRRDKTGAGEDPMQCAWENGALYMVRSGLMPDRRGLVMDVKRVAWQEKMGPGVCAGPPRLSPVTPSPAETRNDDDKS